MSRLQSPALGAALLALALQCVPAAADNFDDASRLFKQGNHAAALEKIEAAITANPRDARARFLKGVILTEQNKPNDAIKVFTALTDDYPELPEPYNNLAVLYAQQGQYDKARKSLEMAISTHPRPARTKPWPSPSPRPAPRRIPPCPVQAASATAVSCPLGWMSP